MKIDSFFLKTIIVLMFYKVKTIKSFKRRGNRSIVE